VEWAVWGVDDVFLRTLGGVGGNRQRFGPGKFY